MKLSAKNRHKLPFMVHDSFKKTLLAIMGVFLLSGITTLMAAEDNDADATADDYEIFFGLDPENPADAGLDYDGDFLCNTGESLKLTDPFEKDTDRDGFSDLIDSNAVSRAYFRWGDPHFTQGSQYEYAHPDWVLGAYCANDRQMRPKI